RARTRPGLGVGEPGGSAPPSLTPARATASNCSGGRRSARLSRLLGAQPPRDNPLDDRLRGACPTDVVVARPRGHLLVSPVPMLDATTLPKIRQCGHRANRREVITLEAYEERWRLQRPGHRK